MSYILFIKKADDYLWKGNKRIFLFALETAHTSVARQIQGLSRQSATVCIATLDLAKLLFIWRILLVKSDNIYQTVAIRNFAFHLYELGVYSYGFNEVYHRCILQLQFIECIVFSYYYKYIYKYW